MSMPVSAGLTRQRSNILIKILKITLGYLGVDDIVEYCK